jgi:hypothetical protein
MAIARARAHAGDEVPGVMRVMLVPSVHLRRWAGYDSAEFSGIGPKFELRSGGHGF